MEIELKQAQVILKKTKITKTVLSQSESVFYRNLDISRIIGWCYDGKNKTVVSYNPELNVVNRSIYLKKYDVVEITKDNLKSYLLEIGNLAEDLYYIDLEDNELLGQYVVYVYNYSDMKRYDFKTKAEVDDYVKVIKEYCAKVEQAGQFYL